MPIKPLHLEKFEPGAFYHVIVRDDDYLINAKKILDWFGNIDAFIKFHQSGNIDSGRLQFIEE